MSWDPALEQLMPDTITVEPFLGDDGFGGKLLGPPVSVRCKITGGGTQRQRLVIAGQELSPRAVVSTAGPVVIDPRSELTLPARFLPRKGQILRVEAPSDEDGHHHTLVYVGD